jgi:hypothetical protein
MAPSSTVADRGPTAARAGAYGSGGPSVLLWASDTCGTNPPAGSGTRPATHTSAIPARTAARTRRTATGGATWSQTPSCWSYAGPSVNRSGASAAQRRPTAATIRSTSPAPSSSAKPKPCTVRCSHSTGTGSRPGGSARRAW